MYKSNAYLDNFMIRLFDVLLSSVALIVFFPFLALITLLMACKKQGVFFCQARVGKDLHCFTLLKFKTMVDVNVDNKPFNHNEKTWSLLSFQEKKVVRQKLQTTQTNDIRITKIGGILRKTSLDELPQLINVIVGDMSLVGPRPDLIVQEVDYSPAEWKKRHIIRPGITGLAQIYGRSTNTHEQRTNLDLKYVREKSVFLYLKILSITALKVFSLRQSN